MSEDLDGGKTPGILVAAADTPTRGAYFPQSVRTRLERLGRVRYWPAGVAMSPEQLGEALPGMQVCVTHWGCPRFSADVLRHADDLKLIAHAGGSVADLVTEEVFARGIRVTSANGLMARHVAEGVLGLMLADLYRIPERDALMRSGGWLYPPDRLTAPLEGMTIGLVGLGAIGSRLLQLLRPFGVRVLVYDPFLVHTPPGVELAELELLCSRSDIVSLHAALTSQSRGLIGAPELRKLKDGALLINTARAGLIERRALLEELARCRIRAVLDVFDHEPLAPDDELRGFPNAMTLPHVAGSSSGGDLAGFIVDEIRRWLRGEPLCGEVDARRAQQMTHDT